MTFILKNIFLGLIISLIILILQKKYKFNNFTKYILIFYSFTPLFVIGVIFDQTYMWDTIVYLKNINFIRGLDFELILPDNIDTKTFSFIYSIIPLPISENTNNIGFYSKFIYILFIIFLLAKNYLKENTFLFYFFLIWPSAIIYSSVGLKEIPTLILTFLIVINLINEKYYFVFFNFCILFLLKDQNAYILLVIIFLYIVLVKANLKKN